MYTKHRISPCKDERRDTNLIHDGARAANFFFFFFADMVTKKTTRKTMNRWPAAAAEPPATQRESLNTRQIT